MRNIPVDLSALSFVVAGEAEAKIVDRATGEIKRDAEGRELYTVPLLPKPNDDRRNPVIVVTFPSATFPSLPEGVQVRPVGLAAFFWQMNGRSGLGFRAETIVPANGKAA
ncbi:SCO3933 family regulatory protein [Herbidospora daliensis]|uniref:SCO3933 family regulatory protein n=1 Tax=Herbidospora daliensis TaxID=295585 RepID=UPI000A536500|nr:hypothetical protein [Herbidospora daliensis]